MLQNQRACQLVRSKTGCEPLALAVGLKSTAVFSRI